MINLNQLKVTPRDQQVLNLLVQVVATRTSEAS